MKVNLYYTLTPKIINLIIIGRYYVENSDIIKPENYFLNFKTSVTSFFIDLEISLLSLSMIGFFIRIRKKGRCIISV